MTVVVNELEVVPAEGPPAPDRDAPRQPAAPARPRDPERELDRRLRRRQARGLRLMAT